MKKATSILAALAAVAVVLLPRVVATARAAEPTVESEYQAHVDAQLHRLLAKTGEQARASR